jgi:hypothetical protein
MLPLVATSKKQSSDFRSEILRLTRSTALRAGSAASTPLDVDLVATSGERSQQQSEHSRG